MNEKFGGAPRPNESEDEAFKKFMESVEDTVPLEDISVEKDEEVRLDSANEMIKYLNKILNNVSGELSPKNEDYKETCEMIMTLEKLQRTLPDAKNIGLALSQLRILRNKLDEVIKIERQKVLRHKLHEETV